MTVRREKSILRISVFAVSMKPALILFAMVCAVTGVSNLDEGMPGFIRIASDSGVWHIAVQMKTALADDTIHEGHL